jgi:hypothetical protein
MDEPVDDPAFTEQAASFAVESGVQLTVAVPVYPPLGTTEKFSAADWPGAEMIIGDVPITLTIPTAVTTVSGLVNGA